MLRSFVDFVGLKAMKLTHRRGTGNPSRLEDHQEVGKVALRVGGTVTVLCSLVSVREPGAKSF